MVHQLAPSGSTSLFLDTLAGFTARPGFGGGARIGSSMETGVGFFATNDAVGPDLLARRQMRSARCDAATER